MHGSVEVEKVSTKYKGKGLKKSDTIIHQSTILRLLVANPYTRKGLQNWPIPICEET